MPLAGKTEVAEQRSKAQISKGNQILLDPETSPEGVSFVTGNRGARPGGPSERV